MMAAWDKQAEDMPELHSVIQAGLQKLQSYQAHMTSVPAYVLTMGEK